MEAIRPSAAPDVARADWSRAQRIGFRLAFAYFVLYSFPFPIGLFPGTERLSLWYEALWNQVVPWVGKHVLQLGHEISLVQNGSGDTSFAFVQQLCFAVLAGVATLVWSGFARRREYAALHDALRIYLRYVLAYTMLGYGMAKLFKSQFPFPSALRLMQPYGDSSPMALLWTFMGFSTWYTVFGGATEALGAVLLFLRRTTTLGALVLLAVIGNIVMLNFSYDVPVKLYSVNLWLMTAFLLLPDARRLVDALVLNRPTAAVDLGPPWTSPGVRRVLAGVKVLVVGLFLIQSTKRGYDAWRQWGDGAAVDPLDGAYEVEQFAINGQPLPPSMSETRRWRRVGISMKGRLLVRLMDDSMLRFRLEHDAKQNAFTLSPYDGDRKFRLAYTRRDAGHLTLDGTLLQDSISVRLRRIPTSEFPLVNRGFHWINEFPYNQ